jgi:hypothetical protein
MVSKQLVYPYKQKIFVFLNFEDIAFFYYSKVGSNLALSFYQPHFPNSIYSLCVSVKFDNFQYFTF